MWTNDTKGGGSTEVSLTYLRPFYPQREDDVRRSPYGHWYVAAPYAARPEWEFAVEELLEEVQKAHGIRYTIRYVADPRQGQPVRGVPVESSRDVHLELAGKGDGLTGKRRVSFDGDLRDTRGKVSPSHMLLVEVDGTLRWYEGPWHGWHARIVQFLDGLLRLGPAHVEDRLRIPETFAIPPPEVVEGVASQADSPVERELIRNLLLSGALGAGEPEGQVKVGYLLLWGKHGPTALPRAGLKFVDLVHYVGPDLVWVVEAKEVLNWSALGQALGYATLFREDYFPNGGVLVRPAITCREVDDTVLRCAELRDVAVFADGERRA